MSASVAAGENTPHMLHMYMFRLQVALLYRQRLFSCSRKLGVPCSKTRTIHIKCITTIIYLDTHQRDRKLLSPVPRDVSLPTRTSDGAVCSTRDGSVC